MIEVILKQELAKLGNKGELVRVAPGFARNYLYPKDLAMPATPANRKQLEAMRKAADREAARLLGDAEKQAEILRGLDLIRIVAKAGEFDQLFGSVTSRDIAAELEKAGCPVDRHKIIIEQPIRTVGDHKVIAHLHRDIDVELTIRVLAEGREQESEAAIEAAARGEEEAEQPQAEQAAAEAGEEAAAGAEGETGAAGSGEGEPAAEAEDAAGAGEQESGRKQPAEEA